MHGKSVRTTFLGAHTDQMDHNASGCGIGYIFSKFVCKKIYVIHFNWFSFANPFVEIFNWFRQTE